MPTWEIPPVTITCSITVQDELQVFGDTRTRQGGGTGRNNGGRRTHGCRRSRHRGDQLGERARPGD